MTLKWTFPYGTIRDANFHRFVGDHGRYHVEVVIGGVAGDSALGMLFVDGAALPTTTLQGSIVGVQRGMDVLVERLEAQAAGAGEGR